MHIDTKSLIHFQQVSIKFNNKVVLTDFNLMVQPGEKIVITGKSGIGKSTIFRLLLGYVQPDNGQIMYQGKVLDKKRIWQLRREIAYVNQNLEIGQGKVSGMISRVMSYNANRWIGSTDSQITSNLNWLDLNREILNEEIESLSGGEKQRIAILITLLLNRNLFLLDEVTSQLDQRLKDKVSNAFLENRDWTVLIISHDPCWKRKGIQLIDLGE
jgi:putative ABC transport system ATP-binding protein